MQLDDFARVDSRRQSGDRLHTDVAGLEAFTGPLAGCTVNQLLPWPKNGAALKVRFEVDGLVTENIWAGGAVPPAVPTKIKP